MCKILAQLDIIYFGCCFIIFAYFISVFIWVFSFVCISDRFACYSRDYHRSFFLLLFWFLLLLESYIHIWIALLRLVLFGVGFSSTRTARRWDERCERVRILKVFEWNTSDMRIYFFLPLTNFYRYYHVKSKQHTTLTWGRT
jgi:hypothetical protein